MKLGKSSNPILQENRFENLAYQATGTETMTVQGTINKTALLFFIVVLSAYFTWDKTMSGSNVYIWLMLGIFGGLIAALVTSFKPQWAFVSAPIYAAFEGLALGAISALYTIYTEGSAIVLQAILLTFGILFTMLFAYKSKMIEATPKFKRGVIAATGGIFIVYMLSWILGMFGVQIPFLHQGGTVGIIISLVIIVIAAMNLILDFDFIEKSAEAGSPKFLEWYGAFGIMVTLIWLYLEILRLLAILQGKD